MVTTRTIGSGSKDATPIASPRTANFVKGATTCDTRTLYRTTKVLSSNVQGIFSYLCTAVFLAKSRVTVQGETTARSGSVGMASINKNDKSSHETRPLHAMVYVPDGPLQLPTTRKMTRRVYLG